MIHLNEAGVQVTKQTLPQRLRLLWRVFCYVFRPNVYHQIHTDIDNFGRITVSGWIKKPNEVEWKYHYVAYDGTTAPSGYVDGKLLEHPNTEQPKMIGKTYELKKLQDQD